nr:hypothetical protein [Burkholderia dolosa]
MVERRSERRQSSDHGACSRQERHRCGERVAAGCGREPADDADRPAHRERLVFVEPDRHERAAGLDRAELVGGRLGCGRVGLEQHGGRQQLAGVGQQFDGDRRRLDRIGQQLDGDRRGQQ